MATTKQVWCLVIDEDNSPMRGFFEVSVNTNTTISRLKEMVKEEMADDLKHVNASQLKVLRSQELRFSDDDTVEGELGKRKITEAFSKNKVTLDETRKVVDLGLSEDETLFVQAPNPPKPIWCLVIDEDNSPMGGFFEVSVNTNTTISRLKEMVKEKMADDLKHVNASQLKVFRSQELRFSDDDTVEAMKRKITEAFSKNKVTLGDRQKVMDLGLSEDETLFVQTPNPPKPIWCLVIDEDNSPVGDPVEVLVNTNTTISGLKKMVRKEMGVSLKHVNANQLMVQWSKEPRLLVDKDSTLQDLIASVDFSNDAKVIKLPTLQSLAGLELSNNELLFVQVSNIAEGNDTLTELAELQRYKNTVNTKGMTPSNGSKSSGYLTVQKDPCQAIHDGMVPPEPSFSTVAPPIHIFHSVFHQFTSMIKDPNVQLATQDLVNVQNLMRTVSTIYTDEKQYRNNLNSDLETILEVSIMAVQNTTDKVIADGLVTLGSGAFLLVEEVEASLGNNSDPSMQAGISMRRHWIDRPRNSIRDKCCCPTFIIAAAGPWLCIMGGVFVDKVIVQRLTDLKWLALSSTEEDARVEEATRVFVALRHCLATLKDYYKRCQSDPSSLNKSRFFPYPTSYMGPNKDRVEFEYVRALEKNQPRCVTFLAQSRNGDKMVIKFVSRYGKDVHEHLASKGKAPKLHYFGPIEGPDTMHMVVMEYIDGQPIKETTLSSNSRKQIEDILVDLHSNGYVFGDLREPNILCDSSGGIFLIDFNWCGRYNTSDASFDGVPDEARKRIESMLSSVADTTGPFARYPLTISQVNGMWVDGVEPRGLILPQHDWKMLAKLC